MAICYREFAAASARRLGVARFATVAVAAAITFVASTAEAATLEDIVKLTQVGVADTVLIELIDMNPTPYSLAPSRLRALQQAGVSNIVLLALLRNGFVEGVRNPSTDWLGSSFSCRAETPTAAAPSIPVPVPVPVAVPVPVRTPRRTSTQTRSAGPLNPAGFAGVIGFNSVTVSATTTVVGAGNAPVYWGWGGQKRPGSWDGHAGEVGLAVRRLGHSLPACSLLAPWQPVTRGA